MRNFILIFFLVIPHFIQAQGGCTLLYLLQKGMFEDVQKMNPEKLRKQVNCFKSGEWISPLMLAIQQEEMDLFWFLLDHGADINQTLNNKSVLDHAPDEWIRREVQEVMDAGDKLIEYARTNQTNKIKSLLEREMTSVKLYSQDGYSAIATAAENGHEETIALLLEEGSPVDLPYRMYHSQKTPLQLAAQSGHLGTVEMLIAAGADIEGELTGGYTPLALAINSGHTEVAKYLIDHHAHTSMPIYQGITPLILAAYHNNLEIIQYIFENSTTLEQEKIHKEKLMSNAFSSGNELLVRYLLEKLRIGKTGHIDYLINASESGNLELVKMLVEEFEVDVNSQGSYNYTPLSRAAIKNDNVEVIGYLLERGADIDGPAHAGYTPITRALSNYNNLLFLLENGANPNPENVHQAPIASACALHHYDAVKLLVEFGADMKNAGLCRNDTNKEIQAFLEEKLEEQIAFERAVAAKNNDKIIEMISKKRHLDMPLNSNKTTLLMLAVKEGNYELAKILLDRGVKLYLKDKNGNTAFTYALLNENILLVKLLITMGASINEEIHHATPLLIAIKKNNFELIELLLLSGADANITSTYNASSPFMQAASYCDLSTLKLLMKYGADPYYENENGSNAVLWAARSEHIEVLQYLIEELELDVNSFDRKHSSTALINATVWGKLDLVEYLIAHGADPYLSKEGYSDAVQLSAYDHNVREIFEFFLAQDYRFNDTISEQYSLITKIYLENSQGTEILKKLIDVRKVNINYRPVQGRSLLVLALEKQDEAFFTYLLNKGADPNITTIQGVSPLLMAIQNSYRTLYGQKLIEAGALLNTLSVYNRHREGQSPLMAAVSTGKIEWVELLLRSGADPNLTDKNGRAAFHQLKRINIQIPWRGVPIHLPQRTVTEEILYSNKEILELLARYKAKLLLETQTGHNAFLEACAVLDLPAIRYLLEEFDFDVNHKTGFEARALSIVLNKTKYIPSLAEDFYIERPIRRPDPISNENYQEKLLEIQTDVFSYLIEKGANPDFTSRSCMVYDISVDKPGHFVFYIIAHYPSLFHIIQDKVDINLKHEGHTPLSVAVHFKRKEIIHYLEKKIKRNSRG